jgi:hypothetical protein
MAAPPSPWAGLKTHHSQSRFKENIMRSIRHTLLAGVGLSLIAVQPAFAADEPNEIVVTGTRAQNRTKRHRPPVDVLSIEALAARVRPNWAPHRRGRPFDRLPRPPAPMARTRSARPRCAASRLTRRWC